MTKVPHIDRLHTVHSKASVALDELQREARNEVSQALEAFDRLKLHCQQQALTIAELQAEVRDLRAQLSLCKVHTPEAAALLRAPLEADLVQLAKDTIAAAHPELQRIPAGGIPVVNESLSGTLKAFFGGK